MTTGASRQSYGDLFTALARERASLLPGLHLLQHHDGYVSSDGLLALSNHIRVPAVEVHAAASSYSELRFSRVPADLKRVCTGLACRLNGSDLLLAAALAAGEPCESVPCMFACGVAPLVMVGPAGTVHGRVPDWGSVEVSQLPSEDEARARLGQHALLVGGGSCGGAVGSRALVAALRRLAGPAVPVVEAGCDGACWAQPVVKVRDQRGDVRAIATRAGAADAAALISIFAGETEPADDDAVLTSYEAWIAATGQDRRLLGRCGTMDPGSIDEYRARGGYEALQTILSGMSTTELRALIAASGLLGRGGAYFPVARKWETAINSPGEVYLVVNLEEGEPGVFKDRHLCEGDPHAVVEGMLIAAHALRAPRIYVYINGEADRSAARIAAAIAAARGAGLVSDGLFIDILRGAGGYVCGEESVILNSIEGHRAVPRLRPPYPAESGLWGHPTVVNNAETLANLPLIVRHGSDWFRSAGTEQAPGTKLLCLAGALPRAGLIEVPFGTPLRVIVETIGGGTPGVTVALVMGGPSGGLVPDRLLDAPLRSGVVDPGGAILGAGGVTVVDGRMAPLEVVRHLTAYNAAESCGKCTPCREGTARTEAILARAGAGTAGQADTALLADLNETIRLASLCGLGQAAPNPVTSLLEHFPPAALQNTVEPEQAGPPATLARAEREPGQ